MLSNLKAEMARNGIKPRQIADLLGVRLATVYDKLNGKYSFTFSEALAIKETYFPEENLEFLFKHDKQTEPHESEVM